MTLKDAQARIAHLEERIRELEKKLHMERKNGDSIREILATFNPPKKNEVKE